MGYGYPWVPGGFGYPGWPIIYGGYPWVAGVPYGAKVIHGCLW